MKTEDEILAELEKDMVESAERIERAKRDLLKMTDSDLANLAAALLQLARQKEKPSVQICAGAGRLIEKDWTTQPVTFPDKELPKAYPRSWRSVVLAMYGMFLLQSEGNEALAREKLRELMEKMTGKSISDKTLKNKLFKATKEFLPETIPEEIQDIIERRHTLW